MHWVLNSYELWVLPLELLSPAEQQDAESCILRLGGQSALDEYLALMLNGLQAEHRVQASVKACAARSVRQVNGCDVTVVPDVKCRRNLWMNVLTRASPALAKVALQLLAMHATTCAAERDWSKWGNLYHKYRNALTIGKAAQMIFVAENSVTKQIVRQEVLSQLDMRPHALLTAEQSIAIDDALISPMKGWI
jgi:hypothetical protein